LARHVAGALTALRSFDITMETVSAEPDGYVFLNIGAGAERLAAIHDRLYSGPLACHRSRTHNYRPHITVGRTSSEATGAAAKSAIERILPFPLTARIRAVTVFRLDGPAAGQVAWTIPLPAPSSGA
jgi:2'-5' RNA ligase